MTATAQVVAPLSLLLDWAPLVRRADLDEPLTFLSESPADGNGRQSTRPHYVGNQVLGAHSARTIYPKNADEWGLVGNQGTAEYMKAATPPSTSFATSAELGPESGPFDNTTAYLVTPSPGNEAGCNANFDVGWATLPASDQQDVGTYKRSIAVAIKAHTPDDVDTQMRLNFCDQETTPVGAFWWSGGNPPAGVTIYGHQDVTLTANWQFVSFTFPDNSFIGKAPNVVLTTVSGNDTGGTAEVALFGAFGWQIQDGVDISNWLRPQPFDDRFGLHTYYASKNSWCPDCDQPVLLGGATRAATAVAAPDTNCYYGGRTLSEYTLPANGDGITTDQPYLVDLYDGESIQSNTPVSAIWLHWYIEPGADELPADGALQGCLTTSPSSHVYGPFPLMRDPAALQRANGGTFYRCRIPVNLANEGYLNFTPKIVNAAGAQLTFNAYRAGMTSEGPRTTGRHECWVPKRTLTGIAVNDAAFIQIDKFVKDVRRANGIWIVRMLLPYNLSDLTNLNGSGPQDCGMWQCGPAGSADAAFEANFWSTDGVHVNFQALTSRGAPFNPSDWTSWSAAIDKMILDSTTLPAFVAFDIALAWKSGIVVAFGIGEGAGTSISWLNDGDTWHGGTVSIEANTTGREWELDTVNGESHGGIQADRDVTREGGGWIQAIAATKTVPTDVTALKNGIAYHIARRFGPRPDYR